MRKKTEENPSQDTPHKTTAKTNPQLKQNRREPQPSPHKTSENYSQDHTTENHSEDHTIEDKSQEQTTDKQPIDNHKLWVSTLSLRLPASFPLVHLVLFGAFRSALPLQVRGGGVGQKL